MVKAATDTNYTSGTPSSSPSPSSSSSSSSSSKSSTKASGDLAQQINDALTGQSITYESQDKLAALLADPPSDLKELETKFYEAVPKKDILPAQQEKLQAIWDGTQPAAG